MVGDEVLTDPGVYLVGLGNMLVEFPSTLQSMYFLANDRGIASADTDPEHPAIRRGPLTARSSDGLEMKVSFSFQWQLRKEALKPLYDILGGGTLVESLYRDEFVRFARAAIVKSCSHFTADTFFVDRAMITADMLKTMKEAFNHSTHGLDVNIAGLQLREVDMPNAYDEEIILTQEQMEEVNVATAERDEKRTVQERNLMVATEKVKQVIQESLGAAERTRITNGAHVKQLVYYQENQAAANALVLGQFWNSSAPFDRLFDVMELAAYNIHDQSKLLIDL